MLVLLLLPIMTACNEEISFMISYVKFNGIMKIGSLFFLLCAYVVAVYFINEILTHKLLKMTIHKKYSRFFLYLLFLMITIFFLYYAYKERNLEKTRDFMGIALYLFFTYFGGLGVYGGLHMTDENYKKRFTNEN